jgi:hypothetical protein
VRHVTQGTLANVLADDRSQIWDDEANGAPWVGDAHAFIYEGVDLLFVKVLNEM